MKWGILNLIVIITGFLCAVSFQNVSKEEEEHLKQLLNITEFPKNYDVVYPKYQERVGTDGPLLMPRIYAKRTKSQFLNHTVRHEQYSSHRQNLLSSVEQLKKQFDKKCSSTHPHKMKVNDGIIQKGHDKLKNYMSFMRIEPHLIPEIDFFGGAFLSKEGYLIFFIPVVLSLTILMALSLTVCFFYAPVTFQQVYDTFTFRSQLDNTSYLENSANTPIQGYPYFRNIRKIAFSIFKSILGLFFTKLILAFFILSLVVSMVIHGRHMANGKECLLIQAELDLVNPEKGSFFKEFGKSNNNTILSHFVNDLENFRKLEHE